MMVGHQATAETFYRMTSKEDETPGFFVFADPFGPVLEATKFIDECAPRSVVVGGLTCPTVRGISTICLNMDLVAPGSVAGVALRGPRFAMHSVTAQGARGMGPLFTVTKGRDNLVNELNEKPALVEVQRVANAVVRRDPTIAPELKSSLLVGLLADKDPDPDYTYVVDDEFDVDGPTPDRGRRGVEGHQPNFVVRTVVGATADGAIAIGDNSVKEGTLLRLHVRDGHGAMMDLEKQLHRYAMERSLSGFNDVSPDAAFLVSCKGRGAAMYGVPDYEVSKIANLRTDGPRFIMSPNEYDRPPEAPSTIDDRRIPPAGFDHPTDDPDTFPLVPVGGFFANGELGPILGPYDPNTAFQDADTHLHGFTSVIAFIYDTTYQESLDDNVDLIPNGSRPYP